MATPTNPIAATPTTAQTVIGHWLTIIKAHEKLLIAIIIAVTLFHFGNKAYDAYGNYLMSKQTQINLQIAAQSATNAALQRQIDDKAAHIAAQSRIDDEKIQAAQHALAAQQQKDNAMSAPELATRLQALVNVGHVAVDTQPTALPDTLTLDSAASHAVANGLEEIPALQTQLSATQDKLNGCTSLVALSSQQIVGLNTSIALEQKGRAADAKVAAVNQKKAFMHGFKWGFGTGVAVTVVAITTVRVALHI